MSESNAGKSMMGGTVSANEPSTAAPESIPPDTPDV